MRTLKSIGRYAVLALSVLTLSCSDDDDNNGGGNLPSGTYIKSTVDGTAWQTYSIQGTSVATAISNGTGDGRLIMINGSGDMNGSTAMSITLLGVNATGTYELNPDSDNVVAYVANQVSYDNSNCSGATGTLTVTSISAEKVEGTFSLVGKDDENCSSSKNITQGSFRGVFVN